MFGMVMVFFVVVCLCGVFLVFEGVVQVLLVGDVQVYFGVIQQVGVQGCVQGCEVQVLIDENQFLVIVVDVFFLVLYDCLQVFFVLWLLFGWYEVLLVVCQVVVYQVVGL